MFTLIAFVAGIILGWVLPQPAWVQPIIANLIATVQPIIAMNMY